jgi:hypothetical protein
MYARDRSVPRTRHETSHRLDSGEALEQFAPDRACTHPGCEARLSRYNPSDTCSLHAGWADTSSRSYG